MAVDDATKMVDENEALLAEARVKYGENSDEYRRIEDNLKISEINLKEANINLKTSQQQVMDNRELVIKQADDYEKSEQDHIQKANEASEASFYKLGGTIGNVLGLIGDLINKYKEWRDTKKDFSTDGGGGGARANGGPVSSGRTYMVGEEGPELFTPNKSGYIVPNDKLSGNVNNNSEQSIVVNATINTPIDAVNLGNILGQQLAFAGR